MAKRSVLRKIEQEKRWNSRSYKSKKQQRERLEEITGLLTSASEQSVTLRLVKGMAGCTDRQRQTLRGLGLRKVNSTAQRSLSPVVCGMIRKVRHLILVRESV